MELFFYKIVQILCPEPPGLGSSVTPAVGATGATYGNAVAGTGRPTRDARRG